MVLVIRDLDAAAAEAVGVGPVDPSDRAPRRASVRRTTIPPELQERWRKFSMGAPRLEPLACGKDSLLDALRRYVRGIERAPEDFVNVVIPEVVRGSLLGYLLRRRRAGPRSRRGCCASPNIVVTDVPVARRRMAGPSASTRAR